MLSPLILFLFSAALADNHKVPGAADTPPSGTHTHTVQIPYGSIIDEKNTSYDFMRKIEGEKTDCSGFDIGCGFVLTAGHCETVGAKIKMGVKGDQEVGRVAETYLPPGMTVPLTDEGWVNGENANSDIKLLRVDYGGREVKGAPLRMKWDLAPYTVADPKKPELAYIAGYGSTEATWNDQKKKWEPAGPGNKLAAGRAPLNYAGYFTDQFGLDRWQENFVKHKADKRGRICSEPTPGLQTIIQGDSGGPMLRASGHFGGIISSMWRSRPPDAKTPKEPNYLSCYVDLAGHLSWIYATMKPFCSTLPPVPAFDRASPGDRLGAPKAEIPKPVLPRVPREAKPGDPPPVLGPPVLAPPNPPPAPAPPANDENAALIHRTLTAFRRQQAKASSPRYELPDMDGPTREQLREAVRALAHPPRHHSQIGFARRLEVARDGTMELPFGFCPFGQPLARCDFAEVGRVRITAQGVEMRVSGLPPATYPIR